VSDEWQHHCTKRAACAEGDGAHLELPTRQPHHAQRQAAPGGGGEHGLDVGHAVAAAALVGLGLGREAHVVANGVARRARTRWKKGVPAMKNAPPIRRGAEKAELAAAMAAAATSRTGTHAAMVAIVKSLFRVEEPAEEPATAPGGDDGIRVVAEATEGSSSSEVVLPPEWKACLDKKEEKRVASARAEHRCESIEADTTPPSPLKGHQRASEDKGCAASSSGSSTGGSGSATGGSSCSNSQWFSGLGVAHAAAYGPVDGRAAHRPLYV